jgi:hypothetical protein
MQKIEWFSPSVLFNPVSIFAFPITQPRLFSYSVLEGLLSVIFKSCIVKIPSDHQAQDGSAAIRAQTKKLK